MFSGYVWWFLLGALVGWLLNWLLGRITNSRGMKAQQAMKKPADKTISTENKAAHNGTSTASNAPIPAVLTAAIPENAIKSAEVQKPTKPTSLVKTPKVYVLNTAAAKAAGFKPRGPNDLTVIEGIGPKINELLNNAGIITFAQLAKQTVPQMQKILDEAGSARYKLTKLNTWPEQAALAAENKWSELRALQDKLNGDM